MSTLRWWIAILLASATAISYLDRQSFPVAVTEISKHIPISNQQYSILQMLFLLSYAVMYAGGGKIVDVLGTKTGYSIMVLVWSAATALHGLVSGVFGLGIARTLIGLGEGGGFPCSAKAVSEWFTEKERSLAFGIFNTGSSVGAVIAPPLIAFIILRLNWHWVFFVTGTLGGVWLVFWWLLYHRPSHEPVDRESESEPRGVHLVAKERTDAAPELRYGWRDLFRHRELWGLLAAKFLTDSAWFFFIFWLPKYLGDVRHLDIAHIGYLAWIPYALAGVGSLSGGWLSSKLVRRLSLNASRKICLALSAALMPFTVAISSSPLALTLALFSMAFFAHQFWSTILQTLAADIFPSAVVGSVAGMMGSVGSFGAMLFDLLVGVMLTRLHSYSQIFVITSLLHPAAFVLLLILIPRIRMTNLIPPDQRFDGDYS